MKIIKRDGREVEFDVSKIENAIRKAFKSLSKPVTDERLRELGRKVLAKIESDFSQDHIIKVEEVQDLVEIVLIEEGEYEVVKSYILYRASHHRLRKTMENFSDHIDSEEVLDLLRDLQRTYHQDAYDLTFLYSKFSSFLKDNMSQGEIMETLIRSANELTSKEGPKWEYIAGALYSLDLREKIRVNSMGYGAQGLYSKLKIFSPLGLYGSYMLENYSKEEVLELEAYLDDSRDLLLNYSGLNLLASRYLMVDGTGTLLETVQEMYMGIAMHLAIPEGEDRVYWAKKIYDNLSQLKVTMATPTMSNARKPYHQLSSCFIDTVPDSLDGIYRSIDNFAQVSKHGGGMGMYFGKVRAMGSEIRGFKGAAGGVIRWIRLANDTAVAVDQLGVRQGAVAVYLDAWHKDMPEFLQLKTNNGDERMKAHDVFPAVSFPNHFWELAKKDLDADWNLFCPHEIQQVMGFKLEESFGEEWEEKYKACINEPRLSRRLISVKDMVRLVIKSAVETGTPFIFNRDLVNEANPNPHVGSIFSSNLCTEIAQNTREIQSLSVEVDQEDNVVTVTKPGDFVVCNLASLVLGKIDLEDKEELEDVIATTVRALDNVVELNFYPIPYAEITNKKYRAIGLGTSGYHHALAQRGIIYSSEEHLTFADEIFEDINYYAIKASSQIAKEKGSYQHFKGSDWENGDYFEKRDYVSLRWEELKSEVHKNGMRNGYLMAVAPTGSTSIIAGTTAGIDPVMNRYYLEEKKGSILPRVAPDLSPSTFFVYENAHEIDQEWVIKSAGVRQRHIDQGQSVNIYITNEFSMSQILRLYIQAYEEGVKTLYYVRSKALEVEECESCHA